MKKLGKILLGVVITIYVVIAVFLTGCLLNLNDYGVTVFANKTLIIVDGKDFEPDYKDGDLIVASKGNIEDVKEGDDIFFYNTYKNQISVTHAKVTESKKINDSEYTYTVEGNYSFSSQYLIGKLSTAKSFASVGYILDLLESKIAFLIVVVFPCAILFMYEIYRIILELKGDDQGNE